MPDEAQACAGFHRASIARTLSSGVFAVIRETL
jgi:hypothetical protein